ncbi:uncharacterized protein LOC144950552 [Lampetra fluviatilis]
MQPHGERTDRIHSDPPSPPSPPSSASPTTALGSVRSERISTCEHATTSTATLANTASSSSDDDGYEFIPADPDVRPDPAESDELLHRWRESVPALERPLAESERRSWSRVARRGAAVLALGLLAMCVLHAWSVWPLFFPLAVGAFALQTYYHFCRWDKAEEAVKVAVVHDSPQRREV